jgi:uroporphyrinogen decarboxylase
MAKFSKREVVELAVSYRRPPYVPWALGFTFEAGEKLKKHYGVEDLEPILDNHLLYLGESERYFTSIGEGLVRDAFGAVWDRTRDKDIGIIRGCVLPEPDLGRYQFPDPTDSIFFTDIPGALEKNPNIYRGYAIGFSLFERAWTLRGMENLMMDFLDHPDFVHRLLGAIADHNIERVKKALAFDLDCIYFGDDWGQQRGLIMGPEIWKEFIYPQLKRMYGAVKQAGKKVFIHSCGDVDELFDDLIDLGVDCFNPFQPEVMAVDRLMVRYRGRLSFHGGLSTQKTLPYGTAEDVRREIRRLMDLGREGGYIFAPAHAVEGDVPLENLLVLIEETQAQKKGRLP